MSACAGMTGVASAESQINLRFSLHVFPLGLRHLVFDINKKSAAGPTADLDFFD
jgi:hypothetical protein